MESWYNSLVQIVLRALSVVLILFHIQSADLLWSYQVMGPPSTQASQVRLAAHLNFKNLQ
jgi:hypothetical protein